MYDAACQSYTRWKQLQGKRRMEGDMNHSSMMSQVDDWEYDDPVKTFQLPQVKPVISNRFLVLMSSCHRYPDSQSHEIGAFDARYLWSIFTQTNHAGYGSAFHVTDTATSCHVLPEHFIRCLTGCKFYAVGYHWISMPMYNPSNY
jgi:hypothetical protein